LYMQARNDGDSDPLRAAPNPFASLIINRHQLY